MDDKTILTEDNGVVMRTVMSICVEPIQTKNCITNKKYMRLSPT